MLILRTAPPWVRKAEFEILHCLVAQDIMDKCLEDSISLKCMTVELVLCSVYAAFKVKSQPGGGCVRLQRFSTVDLEGRQRCAWSLCQGHGRTFSREGFQVLSVLALSQGVGGPSAFQTSKG